VPGGPSLRVLPTTSSPSSETRSESSADTAVMFTRRRLPLISTATVALGTAGCTPAGPNIPGIPDPAPAAGLHLPKPNSPASSTTPSSRPDPGEEAHGRRDGPGSCAAGVGQRGRNRGVRRLTSHLQGRDPLVSWPSSIPPTSGKASSSGFEPRPSPSPMPGPSRELARLRQHIELEREPGSHRHKP
jgi:hypothetical protein